MALVELKSLDLPYAALIHARRNGLPVHKKGGASRGPTASLWVTEEVAETLVSLERAGLSLRNAARFVAWFDPYTDNLILKPRRLYAPVLAVSNG